jgi:N-acetyl-anhydromuramyl-L-alanine amidase AmpD
MVLVHGKDMMELGEGGIMAMVFKEPEIIKRAGWGAEKPKGTAIKHAPKRIVVHHTWKPTIEDFKGAATIRAIQRYHQVDSGWSDIGYHYLIAPNGDVYEGRPANVIGAHCGNAPVKGGKRVFGNTGSIGIAVIGNFDEGAETPTQSQMARLVQLIVWLQGVYKISHEALFGHRECSKPPLAKTCPGKTLSDELLGKNRWVSG